MPELLDVSVENPPLGSIPVHGTGAIEQLLNTFTGLWILRIFTIRDTLVAQGIPSGSANTLSALADYLMELSPEQGRAKLMSPIFAAWLSRLWTGVCGSQAKGTRKTSEWLQHHIDTVLIILLAETSKLRALGAPAAPITVSADGSLAPLDVSWRLTALDRPIELVEDSTNINIFSDGTHLCRIPKSEVSPGADGRSIENLCPEAIRIEERSYLLEGQVEILSDSAFPELSGRRSPEEARSTLDHDALRVELDRAIELIRTVWPEALDDVTVLFRGLLPIQMAGEGWNSASTGEVPFVLQLTFRENGWPFLLADSILHEAAHTKLDMAMTLTPLLLDDGQKIYRHPWRPDLRPMTGVLLGAHAFLAVLTLYYRALRIWPDDGQILQQYEQRRAEVETAVTTLAERAEFTLAGFLIFEQMRSALAACSAT